MAVTPNTDEAFLREVDEELRRDQVAGIWTRYGRWIIAAIVVGLAGFGGYLLWQGWSHGQAEKQTVSLQQAYDSIDAGNTQAAAAPLNDLAGSSAPGYRALAKLAQGDQLLAAGKTKEAAAKFGEVAGDSSLAQPLRDLALIRQTQTDYDNLPPQTVIDRLKGYVTKDSAWLGSAGELVGIAYLKLHKFSEARATFKLVAESEQVPDTLRQRAVQAVSAVDALATDQKGK